jgi:hypothetical protein
MFVPNDQGIRSPQLRDSRGRLAEVSRISCLAGKNKEIVPNRIRHDRVNRVRINPLCAVKLTTMPATTMVADKLTTTRTVTLGQMCRVHLTRAAVTMTASASRERKLGMITGRRTIVHPQIAARTMLRGRNSRTPVSTTTREATTIGNLVQMNLAQRLVPNVRSRAQEQSSSHALNRVSRHLTR